MTITRTWDDYEYFDYDKWWTPKNIAKIREGWLKPHKQLKPVNSYSKKNILPRSRVREKKQIFLKAA